MLLCFWSNGTTNCCCIWMPQTILLLHLATVSLNLPLYKLLSVKWITSLWLRKHKHKHTSQQSSTLSPRVNTPHSIFFAQYATPTCTHALTYRNSSTSTSTHHRRAWHASQTANHTAPSLNTQHPHTYTCWPPPRTDTILSVSSSTVYFVSKWPKTSNRVFQVTLPRMPCSNQYLRVSRHGSFAFDNWSSVLFFIPRPSPMLFHIDPTWIKGRTWVTTSLRSGYWPKTCSFTNRLSLAACTTLSTVYPPRNFITALFTASWPPWLVLHTLFSKG